MIRILRPKAPDFLTAPGNKWFKETTDAIAHYAASGITKRFSFEKYRDPQMKAALKKVFGKCAYCETIYAAVYDGDIEHFRPKGKVNEKTPQIPGYYWLANDWDNLLLSCLMCNQSRKHLLVGETIERSRGKLDQFPLTDESKRVHGPQDSLAEEEKVRLLLHPCIDDPEEHFQYDMKQAVMIPLTDLGKASVDIYVLQRPDLVKSRQRKLALIMRQVGRVKRELELFNQDLGDEQKANLNLEIDYLLEFTKPEQEYAGMARHVVRQFVKDNRLRKILSQSKDSKS